MSVVLFNVEFLFLCTWFGNDKNPTSPARTADPSPGWQKHRHRQPNTDLTMASTDSTAEVGLMPPPPGVTPNFHHTTPVQVAFIAVFAVTFTLATIALVMRVYTRAFVVKALGFDDRMFCC